MLKYSTLTRLISLVISVFLFSCQEHKSPTKLEKSINSPEKNETVSNIGMWDSLKNLTVLAFLKKVTINKVDNRKLRFETIEDDGTPNDWIKPKDVDTLIALIKSKQQCKCVVDPLSSYLPTNEYAELGGYVILLLKQYKNKKEIRFSVYACPKANEKEGNEIIAWWTQARR